MEHSKDYEQYIRFLDDNKLKCKKFIAETILENRPNNNRKVLFSNWSTNHNLTDIAFEFKIVDNNYHRISCGFGCFTPVELQLIFRDGDGPLTKKVYCYDKEVGTFVYNLIKSDQDKGETELNSEQYRRLYNKIQDEYYIKLAEEARQDFEKKLQGISLRRANAYLFPDGLESPFGPELSDNWYNPYMIMNKY